MRGLPNRGRHSLHVLTILLTILVLFSLATSAGAATREEDIQQSVSDASSWLSAEQEATGGWDTPLPLRDTAAVISALSTAGLDTTGLVAGQAWLTATATPNNDYLARKIIALGLPIDSTATQSLMSSQQENGGFGLSLGYSSDSFDTALALQAILGALAQDSSNTTERDDAWTQAQASAGFLLNQVNADGGWSLLPGGESDTQATAVALSALSAYRTNGPTAITGLDVAAQRAGEWLISTSNPAGGWGSPPAAHDTALVLIGLADLGVATTTDTSTSAVIEAALSSLLAQQEPNGSWDTRVYDTALAMRALSSYIRHAGVAVDGIEVSDTTVGVGDQITVTAAVRNSGSLPLSGVDVALFDGDPLSGGSEIGRQTIDELAVSEERDVEFIWAASGATGMRSLYVLVDPDGILEEQELSDNSRSVSLTLISSPMAPIQVAPLDAILTAELQPTFSWQNAFDPGFAELTYILQLDTTTSFSSLDLQTYGGISQDLFVTAFELPTPLIDGVWYWRVAAANPDVSGPFSQTRSLHIDASPRTISNLFATPDPFSPLTHQQGVAITFAIDGPAQVDVRVADTSGTPIRGFDLAEVDAGELSVTWDGRDSFSSLVPDGSYSYLVTAVTPAGAVSEAGGTVEIDNLAPVVTGLLASPDKFSPSGEVLSGFTALTYTLSEPAKVTTRVFQGNQLVVTLEDEVQRQANFYGVSWDGTDSAGLPVVDGTYNISVSAIDSAGNTAIERNVGVEVDNSIGVIGPISVSPNPVAPGAPIKIAVPLGGIVTSATVVMDDATTTLIDEQGDGIFTGDTTAPAEDGDYALTIYATADLGRVIEGGGQSLKVVSGITKSRTWTQTTFADFYGGTGNGIDFWDLQKVVDMITLKQNPWKYMASMPQALTDFGMTYRDGKIYVVGGWAYNPSPYVPMMESDRLNIYDVQTNQWSAGAPMPTARRMINSAIGADGKLYVFGGDNRSGRPLDTVEAYDFETGQWETKDPMPDGRESMAVVAGPDGKIYLIGGETWSPEAASDNTDSVVAFDPLAGTWEEKAPISTRRARMASVLGQDGKLYIFGGKVPKALI